MRVKNKFILCFLSITLLLMFTIVYASEDTQDVTVYAQTDFASFSHTPKRRSWITTHETSKDVYLYAFESLGGLWNFDGLGKKFSPK